MMMRNGFNTVDIETFIFIFLLLALVSLFYIMYRNHQVFRERRRILKIVHSKFLSVKEMNKVATYEKMLLAFWKPVKSFYPEFENDIQNGKFRGGL